MRHKYRNLTFNKTLFPFFYKIQFFTSPGNLRDEKYNPVVEL